MIQFSNHFSDRTAESGIRSWAHHVGLKNASIFENLKWLTIAPCDLALQTRDLELVASTHGRSIFILIIKDIIK
jgi:hypothetical protein